MTFEISNIAHKTYRIFSSLKILYKKNDKHLAFWKAQTHVYTILYTYVSSLKNFKM